MSPRALGLAAVVVDQDAGAAARVEFCTPEWDALLEWLRFHHVDPHRVLAGAQVIRDGAGCCIRYVGIVVDEHGHKQFDCDDPELMRVLTAPMVEQGEAPPLPYPDVIAALLEPRGQRAEAVQ